MAFEIPDHFAEQYTTNFELLLQEKMPILLPAVRQESYQGAKSAQVIKQFGLVEMQEKTTRNADTVFSEIEHKQRWIFPTDFTLTLPVDKEDELKMLNSPRSAYVEASRAAYARKVNAVIRDAALGSAKTGTNGGTTTPFDTSNQQIAAGSAGLTISKLREAAQIFAENEVMDEPLHIVISPKQRTDLLETTEITSSDYNTVKALVQGEIDTFLGFQFHVYNNLQVDGSSNRRCFAFAESGITFGQWNGFTTRIDERADKEYLWQVFNSATIGATRTQEEKVVEILCAES